MARAPPVGLRDLAKRRLEKLRTFTAEEWEQKVAEAKARGCELIRLPDGILIEIQMYKWDP